MTYIALTIGPIYKTLSSAKKTRELWGGSYLFSYIMKQIILEFKEREFVVRRTLKMKKFLMQKMKWGCFMIGLFLKPKRETKRR